MRVAYPGTSDYHTGMSFFMDVYNRNDSALNAMAFQTTAQSKWLNENAARSTASSSASA